MKKYLRDPASGSLRQSSFLSTANDSKASREGEVDASETNYVELEARAERSPGVTSEQDNPIRHKSRGEIGEAEGRMVDVVLSDMSAPWEQTTGFWRKSLSNPYYRMMNTSGMNFRDHIGSMVGYGMIKHYIERSLANIIILEPLQRSTAICF